MASLGNFHGRQTQQVSSYKKILFYILETIFKTNQYFQTHILRYKSIYFSLLYVVCHKASFICSETESFLTLHEFYP